MTAVNVVMAGRDHVADVDRLAGLRVGHQAVVGVPVLQIEDLGQGMGGPGQGRMLDHRANLLPADPQLAPVAQSPEELLACPCRHRHSSRDFFEL